MRYNFFGDDMREKLINDINRYIEHLNGQGLFVTVHGKGISGLLEHNVHSNPYCTLVKTDSEAWKKCVNCQQKVFREHKRGELFGMCYAGMEEYVFFVNDKTFVSVSGYGIDKNRAIERINRISKEFYLDKNELYGEWSMQRDGASLISRLLFEEATDINFYVGRAVNPAHQNPDLPINFNIKMNLVEELTACLKKMGKRIKVSYF